MFSKQVYLKANVMIEPLFNQWCAWTNLIAPVTSAMYIANSHLKIMQSFVASPQVHVAALKNPAMAGGPFIKYDVSRVNEIETLLEKTLRENANAFNLAEAVKTLDTMLLNEAKGYSIESLYAKTPEILKGYVELIYDLNNNPTIRFVEGLLYNSPYYSKSSQSISLALLNKEDRPFMFSNPRLPDSNILNLPIHFSHESIDELFKMKYKPQPFSYIKEVLNVKYEDEKLFSSFFNEDVTHSCSNYTDEGVRIRYFGHACVLVESKDVSILLDPVISQKYESEVYRYTYSDLPERINYVLITHNHQDHCVFETLFQLRHKIDHIIVPKNNGGTLADPSLKLIFQNIGFRSVREIDEMESIEINGGSIIGLPFFGEHSDLNIRSKLAHFILLKGKSILCAADSNNLEPKLYMHIHELFGDIDVLLIGMECDGAPLSWLYGPLLTNPLPRKMDQSRRLDASNYERALGIVNQLKPKSVYVYAMGQEPWLTYLTSIYYTEKSRPIVDSNKLVEDCISRGITSERLFGCKEILLGKE